MLRGAGLPVHVRPVRVVAVPVVVAIVGLGHFITCAHTGGAEALLRSGGSESKVFSLSIRTIPESIVNMATEQ